jgi:hypothetical protein
VKACEHLHMTTAVLQAHRPSPIAHPRSKRLASFQRPSLPPGEGRSRCFAMSLSETAGSNGGVERDHVHPAVGVQVSAQVRHQQLQLRNAVSDAGVGSTRCSRTIHLGRLTGVVCFARPGLGCQNVVARSRFEAQTVAVAPSCKRASIAAYGHDALVQRQARWATTARNRDEVSFGHGHGHGAVAVVRVGGRCVSRSEFRAEPDAESAEVSTCARLERPSRAWQAASICQTASILLQAGRRTTVHGMASAGRCHGGDASEEIEGCTAQLDEKGEKARSAASDEDRGTAPSHATKREWAKCVQFALQRWPRCLFFFLFSPSPPWRRRAGIVWRLAAGVIGTPAVCAGAMRSMTWWQGGFLSWSCDGWGGWRSESALLTSASPGRGRQGPCDWPMNRQAR